MLQQSQTTEWHSVNQSKPSQRRKDRHPALERLVCAAISNAQLADALLQTPALALQRFEVGRKLSALECRLVLGITDASDIHEFAGRLLAAVVQHADTMQQEERVHERQTEEPALREARAALANATVQR